MAVTERTFRRAEVASLAGLLLQCGGFVLVLLLGLANDSAAVWAEAWHWLGGVPIWLMLLLIFHQKRLEALERLELDELRRQREETGQSALFEIEAEDLLIASRRLAIINRYVLPVVTVLLAAYHVVMGLVLWNVAKVAAPLGQEEVPPIGHIGASMAFLAGAAFLAFLLSRYAVGMSKVDAWRMLRAGGSYVMGNCLATVAAVACLAFAYFGYRTPELVLAWVIPAVLIVLGVEMIFNLILEIYRPRVPGVEPRPAIDSRLLGLVSEPGDVARSIADAINYQFGFEVSKTWFYQLLQKSFGPLVLFQLAALLALSCLVIVEPGERAVVERFGRPRSGLLTAGLYFKLPWPIEQARVIEADRIREILLGAEGGHVHEEDHVVSWTVEHHVGHAAEYDVMVAPPETKAQARRAKGLRGSERVASVPVNLLRVVALLQYRVSDPIEYLYNYSDPEAVLRDVAEQAFLKFAASRDSDELMTAERGKVSEQLRRALESRLETLDPPVGVEVVYAGIFGVHPPPQVADAYEEVGGAELEYKRLVRAAKAEANRILSTAAGGVQLAEQLARVIDEYSALQAQFVSPTDPQFKAVKVKLTDLLARAGGDVSRIIAEAEAERIKRENLVLGEAASWKAQLQAYRLAPRLYTASRYLDVLSEILPKVRKYLIASKTRGLPVVVEFDVKDQMGLYEIKPSSGE